MISQLPKRVNLDKLFSARTNVGNADETQDDQEILNEAVAAIAIESKSDKSYLRLFDPTIAKISRLFAQESLASWLIRAAGLITSEEAITAFQLSHGTRDSIIDVLVKSGKLSVCDVKSVLQAEAMVQEGLLYRGFAASAIRVASKEYIEFREALEFLDLHPEKPFINNNLVKLLSKINCIAPEKMLEARKEALSKGITVGWSLIKNDLICEQLLKVFIETLFAVKEQSVSMDEVVETAVAAIASQRDTMGGQKKSPEATLVSELNLATLDRTFGNLLLASTCLDIEEILFCAEVALEEEQMLEEIVERFELIAPQLLTGACHLSRMLLDKSISAKNCTILLNKLKTTGKPISELMPNMENTLEFTVPPEAVLAQRSA